MKFLSNGIDYVSTIYSTVADLVSFIFPECSTVISARIVTYLVCFVALVYTSLCL